MNEMQRLSQQAKRYKELYPAGTRLCLINMDDPYAPVPAGTRGTVDLVDDIGQIHMSWDNGRTLALVPEVDSFRKLTAKELAEEGRESLEEKIQLAKNREAQAESRPKERTEAVLNVR